jgi:hypothetical protein
MINTADLSLGFWFTVGLLAAVFIASLAMGVFRKVA